MKLEAFRLSQSDRKKVKRFGFFSFSPCVLCGVGCTTSYGIGLNLFFFGIALHLFQNALHDAECVTVDVVTIIPGAGEHAIIQTVSMGELARMVRVMGKLSYNMPKSGKITFTTTIPLNKNQEPMNEGESE